MRRAPWFCAWPRGCTPRAGSRWVGSEPVAKLTADQIRTRDRVESVIRLAAPALNLVLAVGERVSRVVEPDDPEYYPARVDGPESAPPAASVGGPVRIGQE